MIGLLSEVSEIPFLALMDDPDDGESHWSMQAACRDYHHSIFFMRGGAGDGYEAKRVCHRCPVIDLCGEYALAYRIEWGVFGGMNAKERRKELSRRRKSR